MAHMRSSHDTYTHAWDVHACIKKALHEVAICYVVTKGLGLLCPKCHSLCMPFMLPAPGWLQLSST